VTDRHSGPSAAATNPRGPRVLVIDDNDAFARLVSVVLTSVGCQVERAASGAEGLRMIASRPPALIVLDLQMPQMDGIGVLRRLKARKPYDEIPVIVLTAKQTIDDVTIACGLGAKDYMTKPLDPATLITKALRNLPYRPVAAPTPAALTGEKLRDAAA
jgi:CheY-like chemotaxis protein